VDVRNVFRRPVVLVYHGVNNVDPRLDPRRLVASPAHVTEHIRLLLRLGYRFVTAADLAGASPATPPSARTAVLTFDDGFRDALDVVLPLLQSFGISATFYVCPGWFGSAHPDVRGDTARLLDEGETAALAEAGMDIGSHTLTHPDVRSLDDARLAEELESSKTVIERLSGRPCRTFAYPYGLHDARTERAVAAAGYDLAFAWMPGPWRQFAAPRLPGPPRHGAARLALKLAGLRRRRG
jgi:peptidoglycan/xylan/chitin deacetylase (PgdA/CDA1 family)